MLKGFRNRIKVLSGAEDPASIESSSPPDNRTTTTVTPLPEGALLTSFDCQGEDESRRECRVIFPQSAYEQVVQHLSHDTTREHGGFLLGYETELDGFPSPTVIIERAVPAIYTEGNPVRLTFTTETWRDFDQLTENLRQSGLMLQRVGWYHSHPDISIFLSRWDLDVCKTFDRRRYPVALVVDPIGNRAGFFSRKKSGYQPHSPQGFEELHDLRTTSVVTWINMSPATGCAKPAEKPGTENLTSSGAGTFETPVKQVEPDVRPEPAKPMTPIVVPAQTPSKQPISAASPARTDAGRPPSGVWTLALLILAAAVSFLYLNQRDLAKQIARLTAEQSALLQVSIDPSLVTLSPNQSQRFQIASGGTSVQWSVSPQVGSISLNGLYLAPSEISSEQEITVTAISEQDSSKFNTATIKLLPSVSRVSVVINPEVAALAASQSQEFKVSVTGAGSDLVSWSTMPPIGTISADGVYTAPSGVPTRQTVSIIATSVADPRKYAEAAVTLIPSPAPQVSVKVQPAQVMLRAGGKQQFSAQVKGASGTVRWSLQGDGQIGEVSTTGEYVAPTEITQTKVLKVVATSIVDTTKSGVATITLQTPESAFPDAK